MEWQCSAVQLTWGNLTVSFTNPLNQRIQFSNGLDHEIVSIKSKLPCLISFYINLKMASLFFFSIIGYTSIKEIFIEFLLINLLIWVKKELEVKSVCYLFLNNACLCCCHCLSYLRRGMFPCVIKNRESFFEGDACHLPIFINTYINF